MPGISQGATYDWDNMLPRYVEGNYNNAQAEAVAKLMLHCGAAVEMDYGSSSGAVVNYYHLTKYFGYDFDLIANVFRSHYSIAEWADLIDRELSAGRPMEVSLPPAAISLYATEATVLDFTTSTGAGADIRTDTSTLPSSIPKRAAQARAMPPTDTTATAI